METVKVDIQKLQLLNDRIAQTIEALNQVRLSVHGIQHTSSPVTPWTPSSYGYSPYTQAYSQSPWGVQAYSQPYGVPFAQPFTQGISHTTSPITQQMFGMPTSPFTTPFTTPFTNGLSHTTLDPMWQMRAAQTFPFAGYPFVPVSIY